MDAGCYVRRLLGMRYYPYALKRDGRDQTKTIQSEKRKKEEKKQQT